MNIPVLFIKDKKKKYYRVLINEIPDWNGFDKLVTYLENNYGATTIKSYDGPDSRRWIIEIEKQLIELIHSDGYGNYLTTHNERGDMLITKIGKELEERLKKI